MSNRPVIELVTVARKCRTCSRRHISFFIWKIMWKHSDSVLSAALCRSHHHWHWREWQWRRQVASAASCRCRFLNHLLQHSPSALPVTDRHENASLCYSHALSTLFCHGTSAFQRSTIAEKLTVSCQLARTPCFEKGISTGEPQCARVDRNFRGSQPITVRVSSNLHFVMPLLLSRRSLLA